MSHRRIFGVFIRGQDFSCAAFHEWAALPRVAACLFAMAIFVPPGVSAQESPHGKKLNLPCETCHTASSWKDVSKISTFDHSKTNFPLDGQHTQVKCAQCHATLVFDKAPGKCADCHNDVHRAELGKTCDRCHSPKSWLVPDMAQRHNSTRFPLLGAHITLPCQACHVNQQQHEYVHVPVDCVGCHRATYDATANPPHASSGISTDCTSCHAVVSLDWRGATFVHNPPLTGAHLAVSDCNTCHNGNFNTTFQDCYSCHKADYAGTTNPVHASTPGFSTNCTQCHTSTNVGGWLQVSTASFPHNPPLTGAHLAVSDCNTCHNGNFATTAQDCFSCHKSDYAGTTNPVHSTTPGFSTNCTQCHTSTNVGGWLTVSTASFPHNPPLTGAHLAVASCNTCHNGNFTTTSQDCYSCHQADYGGTTNPPHATTAGFTTTCTTCHTSTAVGGWLTVSTASFPHNPALTGAHLTVPDCNTCHNGNFTTTSQDCYSCHATDYNNTNNPVHSTVGYPTTCTTCHTSTTLWTTGIAMPTQYHTQFPTSHGTAASNCTACHSNSTNYAVFSCTTGCHPSSDVNPKHTAVSGYVYDSQHCYSCHPAGRTG